MKRFRRARDGFTLIEVLIALVIAAIALTLGFQTVSASARHLAQLDETTLARWAIENVANDIRLRAASLAPGAHRYVETLLGHTLIVDAEVARTEAPPLLDIALRVADAAQPEKVLDTVNLEYIYEPPGQ